MKVIYIYARPEDLTFGKQIPLYNSTGSLITTDTILVPGDQFIGNATYNTHRRLMLIMVL
jgi:hypothetical protein